ncbi:hypothetical protein LP419_01555 [Massilia sp. H-1]|nr:hypothetical protein LP419_01555 [Massilia sp. H-1]
MTQVADAMRKIGAKVTLQPVKVPHWVRGAEAAELVDYRGRPAGVTQKVVLTALGGSGATPAHRPDCTRDRGAQPRRTASACGRGQGPHRSL